MECSQLIWLVDVLIIGDMSILSVSILRRADSVYSERVILRDSIESSNRRLFVCLGHVGNLVVCWLTSLLSFLVDG